MKEKTAPNISRPVLNRPRTGQDVRQAGGEDCLKKTMINHYKALLKVKPIINLDVPHPHVKKTGKSGILQFLSHNSCLYR